MQHDLFLNPNRRDRAGFPFIVALQATLAASSTWIIAPLTPATPETPNLRLLPVVEHDGHQYLVVLTLMTNLPVRLMRHPVGSIARYRDDLTRALDWLFWGI